MIDIIITPKRDITIPSLPENQVIKSQLKGRILGIESDPYKGNIIVYLDHEAMDCILDDWDELEGLHYGIGENYLEFFPGEGQYEIKIIS